MLISVVALTPFCAFYTPVFTARAQGTAFTY
jgi:hypothetical protein